MKQITQQLVITRAALLYELLLTARTASEGPKDALPTEAGLVRRIEASETGPRFVTALVEHALGLIAPSHARTEHLSAMQAVAAFQEFSVLTSLATLSRDVRHQLRENYMEEFRYFVQPPVVLKKLCRQYPITWPTLNVIEEATSLVTGRAKIFDQADDREEEEEECEK